MHISEYRQFSDILISQGSVTTYLRCGGILKHDFVANLPLSLSAKFFWKSVNIWGSYVQEFLMSCFFDSRCQNRVPCKSGWSNQDAVAGVCSGGPKKPRIKWRTGSPQEKEQFLGHPTAHCEVKGMSGMSQLFSRWLQLFGHSLSVLLQLILILSVLCFCVMNGTGLPRLSRKRGHYTGVVVVVVEWMMVMIKWYVICVFRMSNGDVVPIQAWLSADLRAAAFKPHRPKSGQRLRAVSCIFVRTKARPHRKCCLVHHYHHEYDNNDSHCYCGAATCLRVTTNLEYSGIFSEHGKLR